jgi:cytochrome bd-type quinol oxidase subunit 1
MKKTRLTILVPCYLAVLALFYLIEALAATIVLHEEFHTRSIVYTCLAFICLLLGLIFYLMKRAPWVKVIYQYKERT